MKVKDCVLIEAFKCKEEDSVIEVAKKLRETMIRHIFVINNKDYPTGVISVMDINNRVVAEEKDAFKLKASEIMSSPVDVVKLSDDINAVVKKMAGKNRVMNPVVDKNKKMIGIITLNQLLENTEIKK
jgi:signal-transduction protein with cAMP-binding, CBS, and nucleotidyltransferase domain